VVPNFLLPLQILSIGLWVYIFLEVIADVHQHLQINEINRADEKVEINQLLCYSKASDCATSYLPLELRCKFLQEVIVYSVNTNKDQTS